VVYPPNEREAVPAGLDIPPAAWQQTLPSVQTLVLVLLKRLDTLEARLNQDSTTLYRPPSADSPCKKSGYSLKAGQFMTSTPSLPRSWQTRHVGEDCLKEIGKPPTEKAGGWRRTICSAPIKVMQRRPHLGPLWWQAAMVMLHVRERAITAFDGGRGTLQGAPTLVGPRLPLLKGLDGKPLGEHVVLKRRVARLQGLAQLSSSGHRVCGARGGPNRRTVRATPWPTSASVSRALRAPHPVPPLPTRSPPAPPRLAIAYGP
jgi:hypothetical protein